MAEDHRRASDWDRKEELVLRSLEDLRLSSDSALKALNDTKVTLASMEAENNARFASMELQLQQMKERLDKSQAFLVTLVGGAVLYFMQQLFGILQHAGK